MARRRLLGCLRVAALAVCALTAACKDKGDAAKTQASTADFDKRCEQLGRVCGDKNKHDEKIIAECKLAAKPQVEKGCADKVVALYDCYERELCGSGDKVWTIEDLRVLAERHSKCATERTASRQCVEKK